MNDSRAASLLMLRNDQTGFTVGLTKSQIQRILNGCASLNLNSDLIHMGINHGLEQKYYKHQPDLITRWVQVEQAGSVHPSSVENIPGATRPLQTKLMRVVILRCKFRVEACSCEPYHEDFGNAQPRCWLDGTMGKYKLVDALYHVLYDLTSVCIVSAEGKFLFMEKRDLASDSRKANSVVTASITGAEAEAELVEPEDLAKFDQLVSTMTDQELGLAAPAGSEVMASQPQPSQAKTSAEHESDVGVDHKEKPKKKKEKKVKQAKASKGKTAAKKPKRKRIESSSSEEEEEKEDHKEKKTYRQKKNTEDSSSTSSSSSFSDSD